MIKIQILIQRMMRYPHKNKLKRQKRLIIMINQLIRKVKSSQLDLMKMIKLNLLEE
jgi:hypothetical protein